MSDMYEPLKEAEWQALKKRLHTILDDLQSGTPSSDPLAHYFMLAKDGGLMFTAQAEQLAYAGQLPEEMQKFIEEL